MGWHENEKNEEKKKITIYRIDRMSIRGTNAMYKSTIEYRRAMKLSAILQCIGSQRETNRARINRRARQAHREQKATRKMARHKTIKTKVRHKQQTVAKPIKSQCLSNIHSSCE